MRWPSSGVMPITPQRLAGHEIGIYYKRVLKRLDVTSRSLIALIDPGSAFRGALLELALACDRQYMLDGFLEEETVDRPSGGRAAQIVLSESNFGVFPMSNGLSPAGFPVLR